MRLRKIKAAAGVVMVYLILTAGAWMFISSCAATENRLSDGGTVSGLSVSGGGTVLRLGEESYILTPAAIPSDSELFLAAYILLPDEIRAALFAAGYLGSYA